MEASVRVREGDRHDLPLMVRLEGESFAEPWTRQMLDDSLHAPQVTCLVAEEDGEAVGYCLFSCAADEAEVQSIAVSVGHRRRGVGRALVAALVSRARETGARRVWLEVRRANRAAAALYRSCGFTARGTRHSYYADGEDAITMARSV